MFVIDPNIQMWVTLAIIGAALVLYALERTPIEVTALGVLGVLLVLFYVFPLLGPDGGNVLDAPRLLEGFANPALITVLALLVIGQGLVRTGALDRLVQLVFHLGGGSPVRSTVLILIVALTVSAFLNNIPVVVMFIPVMQAVAERFGRSPSSLMMPLSFAAILGGMTTLIGSSTNLLVSSELVELGREPFSFFSFTTPGLVMAGAGLAYILLLAPRILPHRASFAGALIGGGRQFIAQITIPVGSKLVGEKTRIGFFPSLKDFTIRMIQRREHAFLPPFEDFTLRVGDIVIVAATRQALTDALSRGLGVLIPGLRDGSDPIAPDSETRSGGRGRKRTRDQVLAEVMVAPGSRMIGQNLEQIGFRQQFHCIVLGIQRRARMIRARLTEIPLAAGDVLLIQGRRDDVVALRANRDVVLMEWSASDLPTPHYARRAGLIFLTVAALAAGGLMPIVVAAVAGAAGMIAAGVLNIRQAAAAIDRTIIMTIATALALGAALQETGGAVFIANNLLGALSDLGPAIVLSAFFLMVAVLSNALSTKTSAVLFTPIAVSVAGGLGVEPTAFAVAVVFASNCSFASPIGYQTNLLVMGPGHYRFIDFVRAGSPLLIVIWIAFSLFAPWYYGLS